MNEQEQRKEETARLDRQQAEQHAAEGRQLSERALAEERQRQETQRMQEEQRRQVISLMNLSDKLLGYFLMKSALQNLLSSSKWSGKYFTIPLHRSFLKSAPTFFAFLISKSKLPSSPR